MIESSAWLTGGFDAPASPAAPPIGPSPLTWWMRMESIFCAGLTISAITLGGA